MTTGWTVELGDGCFDAVLNTDVRRIARRLYWLAEGMSPKEIFKKVASTHPPAHALSPDAKKCLVEGGDAMDHRFTTASIANLSVDLLQFVDLIDGEALSVGHKKITVVFKEEWQADEAKRLDLSLIHI